MEIKVDWIQYYYIVGIMVQLGEQNDTFFKGVKLEAMKILKGAKE